MRKLDRILKGFQDEKMARSADSRQLFRQATKDPGERNLPAPGREGPEELRKTLTQ